MRAPRNPAPGAFAAAARSALTLALAACDPDGGCVGSDTGGSADSGDSALGEACEGMPWFRTYGVGAPDTSWALTQATGGDILFASHEGPFGESDLRLRRFREDGTLVWEGRWGSEAQDEAFVVTEAAGVAYVGGLQHHAYPDVHALLVRFDLETGTPLGEPWIWTSPGWDEMDGIGVENDAIFLSGWTQGPGGDQDIRIVRLDRQLQTVWDVTAGTAELDAGNGHLVLLGDRVYVAGTWDKTGVFGAAKAVLAAFRQSDGRLEFVVTRGDGGTYREALGLATDGSDLFAVGWRKVDLVDWQLMLWSWDADGHFLWEAEWGEGGNERARSLAYDPADDSLVVVGTTNSVGSGGDDIVLLRFSAEDGALIEQRTWGGAGAEGAQDVVIAGSRGWLAGSTTSAGAGLEDALIVGFCQRPWGLPEEP